MSFKVGHVASKSMSLGQILEKNYILVCSRGHIFSSILLKFGQNVGYDDFLDKTENGSYLNKTLSQRPHFHPSTLERWSKYLP